MRRIANLNARMILLAMVGGIGFSLAASRPAAAAIDISKFLGGARGAVRSNNGIALEGIMVQLISDQSGIRTTVYSDKDGRYEFPKLESGSYTLRIARPLEYRPWEKKGVRIDAGTHLDDIVLERVSDTETLPPYPGIAAQLTGAEWLLNLPGSAEEKRTFIHSCNWCHSYQQIFRNRYDERAWRTIVGRMTAGAGSTLIVIRPPNELREKPEDRERIIQWLSRVRGPESPDAPFYVFARPRGAATRAVITEYELPRLELATHDIGGDSKGNIWYTPHRSSYIGKLDPRTGIVTQYKVPVQNPSVLPGTHAVWVDKNDVVWLSENWAKTLTRFDPKTEKFTQIPLETASPINTPGFGNFGLAPDGYIWYNWQRAVVKLDPQTGKVLQRYPFTNIRSTYDNLLSVDGRYWAGGQWPGNLVGLLDIQTGQLWEIPTATPLSDPAKGAFDRSGNAWFGGRAGALIKLDTKTRRTTEYYPPTPMVSFYQAITDKNGEVWAGELHGGRFARFNPKTEQWTEYVLPEPYGHDRRAWADNSTDPVSVWYADHEGYMVRIQPLE